MTSPRGQAIQESQRAPGDGANPAGQPHASAATKTYRRFIRQLKDLKGSIHLEHLDADDLAIYRRICGAVLAARAHTRAGGAARITGYLGDTDTFDIAVAARSDAYADLTEGDHVALLAGARRPDDQPRHQSPPGPADSSGTFPAPTLLHPTYTSRLAA